MAVAHSQTPVHCHQGRTDKRPLHDILCNGIIFFGNFYIYVFIIGPMSELVMYIFPGYPYCFSSIL